MAKIIKPLTATEVKNARPEDSPLRDGGGLILEISPASKRWRFDYRKPFSGKRTDIRIGTYPAVSLVEARAKRDEFKALLAQNIDPREHLKRLEFEKLSETLNTFGKVAERWRDNFKAKQVEDNTMFEDWRRLENHIFPKLADAPLSSINSRLLVEVLQPVAKRGHSSVIEKTLRTVVSIMDYAENSGLIEIHNCHKARKSFHIEEAQNNPTIPPEELPRLVADMKQWLEEGKIQAKTYYLLGWSLLTGVRPAEAVSVEWCEIDWENATWHIPAEKMKGRMNKKMPHSVPLSRQALEILQNMREIGGRTFIFNSYANPKNPMSSETVNRVLNRNGYKDILTAHGLRSIVRTYLAKQNVERNTAEAVLSHKIKDRLERTYNRSDYFEERIPVMQMWADYVSACGWRCCI
ncbi:integrase arm-type DNA-binding domain-containing protein [Haemophilus parahaemolyticus]|jgi:hypothetical protein|uniref:tyrosine-type recombinase/integrase n=1 Tax=Haemophilus parahaemolyticus TaxID=735 RepID=UPI00290DA4AF|nr:integrase arm-type DNA-binding domain-containing protein [Haemophilus parahaemolyticus]MDU4465699.1 tyrosine-type recombinase/integrase [Haemophilus parahaemolyticus]